MDEHHQSHFQSGELDSEQVQAPAEQSKLGSEEERDGVELRSCCSALFHLVTIKSSLKRRPSERVSQEGWNPLFSSASGVVLKQFTTSPEKLWEMLSKSKSVLQELLKFRVEARLFCVTNSIV